MCQRELLGALAATLILVSQSFTSPIRPVDVVALTAAAEVVVVGRVTGTAEHGKVTLDLPGRSVPAELFIGFIKVDRVLKGHLETQPLAFEFSVPDMPIGLQGAVENEYGVFFLKSAGKYFAFSDPEHPSLPAVPDGPLPSGDALDRVTITLGQVLNSARASKSDYVRVLDALGRMRTALAGEVLRGSLKSSDADLRLRIAITLVARGNVAGLDVVQDTLLHPGATSPELMHDAAGCLAGLKDPNAIPFLARLIETNNSEIRRGAAAALRQTSSSSALEPLSRLLNEDDPTTRYYAVIGLAEITHQDDWAPSFAEFQRDDGHYISHWRTWAELNVH